MRRPAEKRTFDECINDHPRRLVIESPQPGGLRQGQLQAGHLDEFVFHTVHESMKVHGPRLEQPARQLGQPTLYLMNLECFRARLSGECE